MSDDKLTKVHIDLPNHWAIGGESLWAEDLGKDCYRIRNVPFYAYGLNFYDVVLAIADSPDLKPEVRKVIESSGNSTLRIFFENSITNAEQINLLDQLKKYKASYERATDKLVAIDIEPDGNYDSVFNELLEWQEQELLSFESCEARIEGSFDDHEDSND